MVLQLKSKKSRMISGSSCILKFSYAHSLLVCWCQTDYL